MLDMHGRRVVVVGGGNVGLRRAKAIHEAGAQVVLVDENLPASDVAPGISIVRQGYQLEFLKGAFLVFACTDNRAVNARIARDAHSEGAIVNVVDQPEDCDFYLPSVAADGDVLVAVGTGGTAPALAASLKDELALHLPPRIGEFAQVLGQLREILKGRASGLQGRMEIMRQLSGRDTYEAFIAGGPKAVEEKMEKLLGEGLGNKE
jgi:siroheme synthase-like protein